jgi:hypothetical protein
MAVSVASAQKIIRRPVMRRWPLLLALLLGVITTLPYGYAAATTPADRVYTGLMLDAPDTLQYFSWLRDHRAAWLVPNRMTAQANDPALFNLLWLALAALQNLSGWNNAAIFQVLRLLGGMSFLWSIWWLYGLTARSRREQGWAWAIASCGAGLGVVWVIDKYARGLSDVRYPFDLYVAEPNTLLSLLGYPHFLVAGALIVAIFAAALLAVHGDWRWWLVAAALGLLLALQHAYDLLTVYAVLGGWLLLLALKQRSIPWRAAWGMALVGTISFPPAGYFAWLTSRDPLWRAVLSQFSNADVWTPSPPHLLILIGLPLILAILGWDGLRPLRSRSDGELLIKAWAIAGLALIYLPVSFQIHLLNPWQVPLALLAVSAVERRIAPLLARRWPVTRRWLLPALLLLTLPTNLYLLSWRFVELARHDAPYFLRRDEAAALAWLEQHSSRADVVLSELNLGQFVAAQTDAHAVLAHWAQTIDFYRTQEDVERALDPALSAAERGMILRRYRVSLLLAPRPLADDALDLRWQSRHALIYAVKRGD